MLSARPTLRDERLDVVDAAHAADCAEDYIYIYIYIYICHV